MNGRKNVEFFFFDDQINDPGTISGKVMKFHEAAISRCSWEVVAWAETLSPPSPFPPMGNGVRFFLAKNTLIGDKFDFCMKKISCLSQFKTVDCQLPGGWEDVN